jgi:hypothetical protein
MAGVWSAQAVVNIMGQVVNMPDGPAKGALIQQTVGLRRRMQTGSSVVILLQNDCARARGPDPRRAGCASWLRQADALR